MEIQKTPSIQNTTVYLGSFHVCVHSVNSSIHSIIVRIYSVFYAKSITCICGNYGVYIKMTLDWILPIGSFTNYVDKQGGGESPNINVFYIKFL